jgi:hypothetical protein
MTLQEIYTRVVTHLFTQSRVSQQPVDNMFECQYVSRDGTSCAVGCLIQPRYYTRSVEGYTPADTPVQSALQKSGVLDTDESNELRRDKIRLLTELQTIHDAFYARADWPWDKTVTKLLERGRHFHLAWPQGVPHA